MKTVLNNITVDTTKEPMFLGAKLSLQRYDAFRYPVFYKLAREQIQNFWTPEEVSVELDKASFDSLSKNEQFIFTSNLKYQTLLDSIISRYINTLTEHVSLPELEFAMNTWMFFENIHSYSYTYVIKGIFNDPNEIFNSILEDKEIVSRAQSTKEKYDNLLNSTKDNIKDNIFLSLIATNIMESIKFYVSFACSFAFGQNRKLIGNADILKLINRDENKHVIITQQIIKLLTNVDDEGFTETVKKNKDIAMDMFKDAVESEKQWAEYLFKDGSILGLNEKILAQYIEWLCNIRTKSLGLPQLFGNVKNPIGWLSNWNNTSAVQVAPQEHTLTNYKINAMVNDVQSMDLSGFEL
jgi:ribonucleoside-diphosphate reductase beta chain